MSKKVQKINIGVCKVVKRKSLLDSNKKTNKVDICLIGTQRDLDALIDCYGFDRITDACALLLIDTGFEDVEEFNIEQDALVEKIKFLILKEIDKHNKYISIHQDFIEKLKEMLNKDEINEEE